MSRRVHRRIEQMGLRLLHHIAPAAIIRLDDLAREQWLCDGWPPRGDSAGRGGNDTSTTESAALQADSFGGKAEEINDTIESIEISIGHLAKLVIGIDHTPAAIEAKRCSDGQKGKDALMWSDDEGCMALPVKKDMCQRHYSAWRRHLEAHGIQTLHHFESG